MLNKKEKKEVSPPFSKRLSLKLLHIYSKLHHHVKKLIPYTYYNKQHPPLNHLLQNTNYKICFSHKKNRGFAEAKFLTEKLTIREIYPLR